MSPSTPARPAPYSTIMDALVILVRDDRVLLARRAGTGYADGQWNLPSGKLEHGESITRAAVREAREEIGVHIAEPDLEFVHLIHYRSDTGHARMGTFFHVRRWQGEPHNAEPDKCSGIGWFPLDRLPDATYPYTAHGLAAFRRGVLQSNLGWDRA
ncbi:NUDIX domain-containing protein [Actinomadura logoneensis]|uniref:NUDIX domain-containing protein n=1 Tax=Actinomadura logoneensis TaxID=2293572 RepID=A0A372JPE5_9ACTN|nr:NUDIX domain-containing protein [Actinomadura logoneensis]RFU41893.1 NUDIX domain-containing protein [Actinomadura logoneensis]